MIQAWLAANGIKLIAALVAALAVFLSGVGIDRKFADARYQRLIASHAKELADLEAVSRRREQAWALQIANARGNLDDAKRKIAERDAVIAGLRADSSGLRDQINAYAAGAISDSAAACQQRAAVLGKLAGEGASLLAEGADLLRQCARDVDERSAELRAMIEAWPK